MTALRTPARRVLGLCLIARGGERASADPPRRAWFAVKLRAHQRTLAMMRAWRALRGVMRSDSSVAAYDLANAIQAQGDARMIDDAAAARLMGSGRMAGRAA